MNLVFENTINLGNVLIAFFAVVGAVAAWMRFSRRVDKLEFKVEVVEKTLEAISKTLERLAESSSKMAVMDERQLTLEKEHAAMLVTVEGLRKGEGYITQRRANLEGEYKHG